MQGEPPVKDSRSSSRGSVASAGLLATQVLSRRPSALARITGVRTETLVPLCHHRWLDILCGLKLMPPERAINQSR